MGDSKDCTAGILGDEVRYLLQSEETGDLLFSFRDLGGFFREEDGRNGWREFWLRGCSVTPLVRRIVDHGRKRDRELENSWVIILDRSGERIGAYYVGGPVVERVVESPDRERTFDVLISGFFFRYPNWRSWNIWKDWQRSTPKQRGLWELLSLEEREAWLEVAKSHAGLPGKEITDRESGVEFVLPGRCVVDTVSFFCAMGEAVNGPGGYFGDSLDGLADCLRGGFGASVPFTLRWESYETGRAALSRPGEGAEPSDFDKITGVLGRGRVTIRAA